MMNVRSQVWSHLNHVSGQLRVKSSVKLVSQVLGEVSIQVRDNLSIQVRYQISDQVKENIKLW
jgi:divalent metal cation (Fe/Co/Zn/Cd) transporter